MSKKKLEAPATTTYFIDGTNLCYWVDTEKPTLTALLQLIIVILEEKKSNFYCIFDANTHYKLPDNEKPIYKKLLGLKENFYQVTGGKRADDYILELAQSYKAPVVSNDNYNDPKYKKYKWLGRDHKPCRLFMGEVIPVLGNSHLILSDLEVNIKLEKDCETLFIDLVNIIAPQKIAGTVKFFNAKEGWGRVVYETDIYFNKSEMPDKAEVEEGDQIAFLIAKSPKGSFAKKISLLPPKEEPVVYEGTVVSFDEKKQIGNIQIDGTEQTLFFYKSYFLDVEQVIHLKVGQSVEFVIGTNKYGKCARKVRFTQKTEVEKLYEELGKWKKMVKQLESAVEKRKKYIDELKQQIKKYRQNQQHTSEQATEGMGKSDETTQANAAHATDEAQTETDNEPRNGRNQGKKGNHPKNANRKSNGNRKQGKNNNKQKPQAESKQSESKDERKNATDVVSPKEVATEQVVEETPAAPQVNEEQTPVVNQQEKTPETVVEVVDSVIETPTQEKPKEEDVPVEQKDTQVETSAPLESDEVANNTVEVVETEPTEEVVSPAVEVVETEPTEEVVSPAVETIETEPTEEVSPAVEVVETEPTEVVSQAVEVVETKATEEVVSPAVETIETEKVAPTTTPEPVEEQVTPEPTEEIPVVPSAETA
ncbi:MAG: hypothetical protein ACPGXL_06305, partial [Chitinophagales bacterium]